jgi:hypothetical protein
MYLPCLCLESKTGHPARNLLTILSDIYRFQIYVALSDCSKYIRVRNKHK